MRKIDLLRGHPGTGALACCFYYKDFGAPVSIWESWGYRTVGTLLRVTFFVTDFCFRVAKICNRQAGKSCYSFGFGHVTHGTLENQGFREACYNVTLYFKSIKDKNKEFQNMYKA